jgi:hypothetical protein
MINKMENNDTKNLNQMNEEIKKLIEINKTQYFFIDKIIEKTIILKENIDKRTKETNILNERINNMERTLKTLKTIKK